MGHDQRDHPADYRVLYFAVVVWGERFRRYLQNFLLKSLLSPGKFPCPIGVRKVFLVWCPRTDWMALNGTPNITASNYSSPQSEVAHINLKSMSMLREMTSKYCKNVFMFGMNDEVVHAGYGPMCHYIWSLGVGVREL